MHSSSSSRGAYRIFSSRAFGEISKTLGELLDAAGCSVENVLKMGNGVFGIVILDGT
jgi:hypothetical protein